MLVCETSIVAFRGFLDRLLARLQCARLLTPQEDSESTQAKPVKNLRLLRSRRNTKRESHLRGRDVGLPSLSSFRA